MGDKDGCTTLRKEIDESVRRVRAAKKGQSISVLSPKHETSFFFPDQKKYFLLQHVPIATPNHL